MNSPEVPGIQQGKRSGIQLDQLRIFKCNDSGLGKGVKDAKIYHHGPGSMQEVME